MTEETFPCPQCGGRTVPIMYGLPGLEIFEAAERGEVALGGCCVGDEMPDRQCAQCEYEWRSDVPQDAV